MSDFTIECDIPCVNGKAEGTITVRRPGGDPVLRDSGNWLSKSKVNGLAKSVADDSHPQPQQAQDETTKQFAGRKREWKKQWDAVAADVKKKLLRALDEIEDETRAAAEAAAAAPPAPEDRPPAGPPYVATDNGILRRKMTGDGETFIPLTNFTARIAADVVKDDGAEREHAFEIEGRLGDATYRFTVPAAKFPMLDWAIEYMGSGAIVYAGVGARDHARVAVQTFSTGASRRTIFTHTGWREVDGGAVYLHAGGAIGKDGPVNGVEVDLSGALCGYTLPAPPAGEALAECVRASLAVLAVGDLLVTLPVLCAAYRAVLGSCDAAVHVAGPTGVFKSELAALGQQHFGAGLDARHLPGSWSSTENALEGLAFSAKDALFTVDDFAPCGSQHDVQRFHLKADRIIRAQGNHSGRQRMRADGSLRPVKPPRGLILSTGEDVPRGQSLRARMMIVEVGPGDIDPVRLARCQEDARNGAYAAAMAGFVQWLVWREWRAAQDLRDRVAELRGRASGSASHRRTPDVVANLALGLRYFLEFAREAGAITAAQERRHWEEGWNALGRAAARQAAHQAASEPTTRFLDLVRSAVASGNAHFSGADGRRPAGAESWGWRRKSTGAGAYEREEWHAQGERIGWVDGDDVYLDPDASYKAAQAMAAGGEGLAVSAQTLRKRLHEKGLLLREGRRDELTVRRVLSGSTRRVLLLAPEILISREPAIPAIPASGPDSDPENADPMAGFAEAHPETRHLNPPSAAAGGSENAGDGGNGGNGGLLDTDTPAANRDADGYEAGERAALAEGGM